MEFREIDKQALIQNAATVRSTIEVVGTNYKFTEEDYLVDWTLEDFRYVPNNGFIGQFVERLLDGNLSRIPSDVVLENARIKLQMTINNKLDDSNYTYDYGTFIVTKVDKKDTTGKLSFESCDIAKLFNIEYIPDVVFPCTAIELLHDVCTQVGVPYNSTEGQIYCYAVKDEDNFNENTAISFIYNDTYCNITLPCDVQLYDSIMYDGVKVYVYNWSIDPFVVYELTPTITDTATGEVVVFNNVPKPNWDVTSELFVVDGNHFSNTLCRDVVKSVAKLNYSAIRINENDKLCFDFYDGRVTTVDTNNVVDTDHHFGNISSDTQFGPVDKVVIGLSNVTGENVTYLSEDANEPYVEIGIWDNPITYTDALRQMLLRAYKPSFMGLSYTPLELKTTGHPWLKSTDRVKIIDIDNQEYITYPFNITIKYKGTLSTTLSSKDTAGRVDRDYTYDNSLEKRVGRTEIIVNKQEGTIEATTSKISVLETENSTNKTNIENNYKELNGKFENYVPQTDFATLERSVTQLQTDTYTKTEINTKLTDGSVTKVQTTAGTFDEDGMHYEKTDAKTNSIINESGVSVEENETSNELLFAGYVNEEKATRNEKLKEFEGQSVVYSENQIINKYLVVGSHSRFEDYNNGTGCFYIG